ncbi:hypothetical protein HanPSC8_Chr07g0289231 [Helianthus annuus]|nr:hypothetical protein HanPSC8_Chr07g0289231 [Helianthus annuus]
MFFICASSSATISSDFLRSEPLEKDSSASHISSFDSCRSTYTLTLYWSDFRAKLTAPKRPVIFRRSSPPSILLTVIPVYIGSQSCIKRGERETVPFCAVRITEMFSIGSEYIISSKRKTLKLTKSSRLKFNSTNNPQITNINQSDRSIYYPNRLSNMRTQINILEFG